MAVYDWDGVPDYDYVPEYDYYGRRVAPSARAEPAAGCPVCLESRRLVRVAVPCGHSVCTDCWDRDRSARGRRCATCREKVTAWVAAYV